ncbi:hypothetical protein AHF37_11696 [Paragonimus kellicotti]|nr:hypothetical protein AHF37_11696 [Paragonimus kellicotti]
MDQNPHTFASSTRSDTYSLREIQQLHYVSQPVWKIYPDDSTDRLQTNVRTTMYRYTNMRIAAIHPFTITANASDIFKRNRNLQHFTTTCTACDIQIYATPSVLLAA